MFPDNGSCKAHRGGAGGGEDAKSHYQPTLSGNPPREPGRAPRRLFAKGCRSPPERSLANEQLTKGQEANKRGPAWRPQAKHHLVTGPGHHFSLGGKIPQISSKGV